METSTHALLSAWESYYVIVGSSAAALTGLQFVVIALIADLPGARSMDSIAAFGTPTVFHFCSCLFVAVVLSAPWQTTTPVDLLLLATGFVGLGYTGITIRRARRQTEYEPVAEDWLWHAILPVVAYVSIIVAAILLPRAMQSLLFPIAGAAILLIFIGIHNAWDTVAYLAVVYRKEASGESPGA